MIDYQEVNIKTLSLKEDFFHSTIKSILSSENKQEGDITLIFCSDSYLLDINKKFLDHDYFTDIITFDYCVNDIISGDLYISIDRILENSNTYSSSFIDELKRVVIHGVLHLCGYNDKSEEDQKNMRIHENKYLAINK